MNGQARILVVDDIAQSTSIDYDGNEFISGVHSFTN